MKNPTRSLTLIGLQVISMGYLILSGPVLAAQELLLVPEMVFVIIAFLGVWQMKANSFNAVPDVTRKSRLMTDGIYAKLRNPMYTGIIGTGITLVLSEFTSLRLAALAILSVVLVLKIRYEEELLEERFGKEYREYKKRSFRLIPYLF